MVRYRRKYVPGGTYFFTVTLRDRRADWLVRHIDSLRSAFARVKAERPFRIDAMVVLPEHLHLIMTLPDGDSDYSGRLRLIKAIFARRLRDEGIESRNVWHSRFWEHTIRDNRDLRHHVNYIHFNPVKHGHVESPTEWPYSTIHQHIADGRLPADWGTNRSPDEGHRPDSGVNLTHE
jgi:putative transposase